MLLITDRHESQELRRELQFVRRCMVQPLHHQPVTNIKPRLVIVDVLLDNFTSTTMLHQILSKIQIKDMPTIFLVRGDIHHATVQAQAIGASAILPFDTDRGIVLNTISKFAADVEPDSGHSSDRISCARRGILKAGIALADTFDSAASGKPISACATVEGSTAVLDAIQETSVREWIDLVWQHDDTTYQHCLLVSGLAAAFALQLKFSAEDCRLFAQTALMHDLGKSRIPLALLNKPGKLTQPELDVVRSHPGIGHELLVKQGGFDSHVLAVVRHHHEYLDGTGYPDGLRAAEVPDIVRLATICDIYAALIERRPYKAPISADAAFSILEDMGGKLDRDLVGAFRSVAEAAR